MPSTFSSGSTKAIGYSRIDGWVCNIYFKIGMCRSLNPISNVVRIQQFRANPKDLVTGLRRILTYRSLH